MTFLYPPRPEKAISPSLIQYYEDRGWIAQVKKNGTASVASVDENAEVEFWTRHKERHKAWVPTDEAKAFLRQFPRSVFVFELLHSKGGGVRDTLYFFDVLVFEGRSLIGTTLHERLKLLKAIVPDVGHLLMAHTYTQSLRFLYDNLTSPLDEGIVLKDPAATLRSCLKPSSNSGWQVKCRKETKNFGF